MKHPRVMFCISLALLVMLAACAPSSTPTPSQLQSTQPPAGNAAPAPAGQNVNPVPTGGSLPLDSLFGGGASPLEALFGAGQSSPTQVPPVQSTGQQLQVGSQYRYFDGTTLVAVPGGPFTMGGNGADNPQHKVTLSGFWIYSTKVTNLQYQQCVAAGKCTPPDATDDAGYSDPAQQGNPVVGVPWAQGEAYCEYAHGKLPTEAQWEKTARGPNGNVYPWGSAAPSGDLLNYNNDVGATSIVTNYPNGKSYYDALEMEGNVFEWTWDWYDANYYPTAPAQDPTGPVTGTERSVRSSSFQSAADQVVPSLRLHKLPADHAKDLGFRCVVLNPTFFAPSCQVPASVGPGLNCPSVKISVSQPSCGQLNSAVVSIDIIPWPSLVTGFGMSAPPGTCNPIPPAPHTAKLSCTPLPAGGFNIWLDARCSSAVATCPAGYKLNLVTRTCDAVPGTVVGTSCPAGQQLDSSQNCCTSTPGTFAACPAGSTLVPLKGNAYMCASGKPIKSTAHVNGPVAAASCRPNATTPPQCPPRTTFDNQKNCCVNVDGACVGG